MTANWLYHILGFGHGLELSVYNKRNKLLILWHRIMHDIWMIRVLKHQPIVLLSRSIEYDTLLVFPIYSWTSITIHRVDYSKAISQCRYLPRFELRRSIVGTFNTSIICWAPQEVLHFNTVLVMTGSMAILVDLPTDGHWFDHSTSSGQI